MLVSLANHFTVSSRGHDISVTYCRYPLTGSRPGFRELVIVLTGNRLDVLSIPQEALHSHQLAGVLGSALEAGENMYLDLQNKHLTENNLYD